MNGIDGMNSADFLEELHVLREENERLKKSEERFWLALEASRDGLWDWNLIDNTVFFSPQWKAMVGYTEDELENELATWEKLVHPDDLEYANRAIERSIQDPNVRYSHNHRLRHKDGHYIWNYDHGKVLYNDAGEAVRMIGFHTDITHLKELESQLKDTQELMIAQSRHAAMGEMIGMIAHQWRQPLGIVSMVVNNMLIDIELEELDTQQCKKSGEDILTQVNYLSKTIDTFRDFFRPNCQKERIDVVEIVDEAKEMIDASLKNNNINLLISNRSKTKAEVYSRELLQVVINILKNAKEALMIQRTPNATIEIELFSCGEWITIEICNNGPLIPLEVLPHIFDPYFSTKDEKSGTGLGLYMSKTIIEKHLGGILSAENIENGVCFTIQLPNGEKDE